MNTTPNTTPTEKPEVSFDRAQIQSAQQRAWQAIGAARLSLTPAEFAQFQADMKLLEVLVGALPEDFKLMVK
jgi:hypothetical protein